MNVLGPIEREADERSVAFVQQLRDEAKGDLFAELELLDVGLQASKRHSDRMKARRLEIVKKLRNDGIPMTEIASAANMNDSYLARKVIADGGKRIVDRTRVRRRRGGSPPVQGRTA